MQIRIPSPLRSYTAQKSQVEASGSNVVELLDNLDGMFPGIKFRIIDEQNRLRQHIKLFVNTNEIHDLKMQIGDRDTLHIICALSGG